MSTSSVGAHFSEFPTRQFFANVVEGDPRQMIIEEARGRNVDAIFVGARGLGRVERLLLGSVSTYILTHARCTVEVVHNVT